MRNMSFALTTEQVRAKTKTVTRRLGWAGLKTGTLIQPVVKGMGLKPGEKVEKIGGPILVVDVRREPLSRLLPERGRHHTQSLQPIEMAYAFKELEREGFGDLTRDQFVKMFCDSHKGCTPTTEVTRIEFKYVDQAVAPSGGQ